MLGSEEGEAPDGMMLVRRLLLAVIALGCIGLIAELALIGHYEDWQQWIPLVSLGLGLIAVIAVGTRPARAVVRGFQLLMLVFLVAGALGVYFHIAGNVEFEREMDPDTGGVALLWIALRGATPALAPGALVQIGLSGLIAMVRHPALRR